MLGWILTIIIFNKINLADVKIIVEFESKLANQSFIGLNYEEILLISNQQPQKMLSVWSEDEFQQFKASSQQDNFIYQDYSLEKLFNQVLHHRKKRQTIGANSRLVHDRFYQLHEIYDHLRYLTNTSSSRCSLINIGRSYFGQPIYVIRINGFYEKNTQRRSIFIDSGIHPREWIGIGSVLYIIDRLIHDTAHSRISTLLKNVDYYILPIANPDGYVTTWKGGMSRLWRKTMSNEFLDHNGFRCSGADMNRNFDYKWGKVTAGTSYHKCSEFYFGEKAFSERESQSLAQFLQDNQDHIKAYLTVHSYGQYWIHPYSDSVESIPHDLSDLQYLSADAVKAIHSVRGTRFTYGSSPDVLYPATGTSMDWVKQSTKIKYSYTMEVFPNRNSLVRFFTSPRENIMVGIETLAALNVLADYSRREN